MKLIFYVLFGFSFLLSQATKDYIDGVAVIVEDQILLKSDIAQMVNMAAVQNNINPQKNPGAFIKLQNSVLKSMVDQKVLLEMAEIDSIIIEEETVNQSLEQQIQMLISQAGGEKRAVEALGQSISDFRREFWYDMRDRLISEKYQQQILNSVSINKFDVVSFFETYKDSLPLIPTKTKLRHLLVPIKPSEKAKEDVVFLLNELKNKILNGALFEELAKNHSDDPGSKNNGGSLGWVKRGSLVKAFETAAFTAKKGDLVGPVETEFGYHLIETIDMQGDKILVRHILKIPKQTKEDEKRAFNFATLLHSDSIKTLEDFKECVLKYTSDETTKKVGGSLGWINPDDYSIPEIGQAIKYININTCSPPINSGLGYHLLWVEGIKKGGRANLQDHWIEIESMTLNKKKMDWYDDWIKKARSKFYIKITEG